MLLRMEAWFMSPPFDSLNKHTSCGWDLSSSIGQFVDLVPAQMRIDGHWYKGTADAVFQNLTHIYDEPTDQVCVFGGDHIYIMDVEQMYNYHLEHQADQIGRAHV